MRKSTALLNQFGLIPGTYVLLVGRFVPEKRHLDLLEAFERSKLEGWSLVFAGASDHKSEYEQEVLARVESTKGAISTGFLSGETLAQIYSHAGIFVLPSSHDGLPIALLKALSFGLPCIASDIAANLEVGLEPRHYFHQGSIDALTDKLRLSADATWSVHDREETRESVAVRFDWQTIAQDTLKVYQKLAG